MSGHRTAEESKSECIEKMGQDLGTLYSALWQEFAWLNFKWGEYNLLFGKGANRIALLNETAPFFFNIIQRVVWEDSILHIARLTDRPKSLGKENLTFCQLPSFIGDPELKLHVEELIGNLLKTTTFCRDWRNRHIAHKDLALALKKDVPGLEPADKTKMDTALKAIGAVLDAISLHYLNSTTMFGFPFSPQGADRLLQVLDDGEKYEDLRKAALEAGDYSDAYYKPKYL